MSTFNAICDINYYRDRIHTQICFCSFTFYFKYNFFLFIYFKCNFLSCLRWSHEFVFFFSIYKRERERVSCTENCLFLLFLFWLVKNCTKQAIDTCTICGIVMIQILQLFCGRLQDNNIMMMVACSFLSFRSISTML